MRLTEKFPKLIYLRLLLMSLAGALLLSLISVFTVVRVTDMVVEDYRYGYLVNLAKAIEHARLSRPISWLRMEKLPLSISSQEDSLMETTEFGLESPARKGPLVWIVDEGGKVLSSNAKEGLPLPWQELPHPKKFRRVAMTDNLLLKPKIFVVKLETRPVTFLVSHNAGFIFQGTFLWVQGAHVFITAALAMFLALSLMVFFLRRKSRAARGVLSRLEEGDLKARFRIKGMDHFSGLMHDFNRMASEIEKLVTRVHEAQNARSQLLQELGHDVRTPLTSLSTSFETLRLHHEALTPSEREELFTMLGADIRYFRDLLEQLTVVASINVPKYKAAAEEVDLTELLSREIRGRQTGSGGALNWELDAPAEERPLVIGDAHLLTRLFRNAFDNASRYASSIVRVSLNCEGDKVEVNIMDDGPGLSQEAISLFGKRRTRRQVKERDTQNFSLGLGSVIMKAIAEVHDGIVTIQNLGKDQTLQGACVKVTFRRR